MYPLTASISITNKCNLLCKHCISSSTGLSDKSVKDMEISHIFNLIDQLKKLHVFIISLTGGEIFVREDLFEIFDYINKTGISISFTSNGTLIDSSVIHRLCNYKLYLVRISLDSYKEEKHDEFRGVQGSFKKTLNCIRQLSTKFSTTVLTTITKENYHDLEEMIDFVSSTGAHAHSFTIFAPSGRGKHEKKLMLDAYDVKSIYELLFRKKHELFGKINIICDEPLSFLIRREESKKQNNTPRVCQAGVTTLEVDCDGYARPCISIPLIGESTFDNSLEEIWFNSELFKDIRDKSKLKGKCNSCEYIQECGGGCRAMACIYSKDLFAPDPHCWIND